MNSLHSLQGESDSSGVGLRGITAIDAVGVATIVVTIVVPGELDDARVAQSRP